jgi:hypothetical protein
MRLLGELATAARPVFLRYFLTFEPTFSCELLFGQKTNSIPTELLS